MKRWLLPRLNKKIDEMSNKITRYEEFDAKRRDVRSVTSETEYTTMKEPSFHEDRTHILNVIDNYNFEKMAMKDNIRQMEEEKVKNMFIVEKLPKEIEEKKKEIEELKQKVAELKNEVFQVKRAAMVEKNEWEEKSKSKGGMLKAIIKELRSKM
jgi:chromosome segregation ATPase